MTRQKAREVALHLIYNFFYSDETAEKLLDTRLSEDVFAELAGEHPAYEKMPDERQKEYVKSIVCGVSLHLGELDSYIEKHAIGWNFGRISRMGIAILRLSMYEVLYRPDIPPAAAMNEAVEFAKTYDSPELAAFINGVLGGFWQRELPEGMKP